VSDPTGVDEYGITDGYFDVEGHWWATSDTARQALRAAIGEPRPGPPMWFLVHGDTPALNSPCHLVLDDGRDLGIVHRIPPDTPIGYHVLRPLDGGPTTKLVVYPERCPAAPSGWGVAAQLYATTSTTSQGIGDLVDLGVLASWVGSLGGNSVLLSPLHAPSPRSPQQDSPYYPASRRWRNPLHIRVPDAPGRRTSLIERDAVWSEKRAVLWDRFRSGATALDAPWRRWADEQGTSLGQWARWCADAEGQPVREVREFHAWLQWCIDRQLEAAHAAAPDVALIGDLAIGFDPSGADAAAFSSVLAHGCRIGAPPDGFNPSGQDWGLPPFSPWKLRAACYEPFVATVRGAIRGLQGLRIDHVMGLFRQYWMAPGLGPGDGAYVRFPADELLAILSIEATRAGAFVVGEDLGTVEPRVRTALRAFGILGTTVAWFEDAPPEQYGVESLATVTTHDLPTIAGVWRGLDGGPDLRERLERLVGDEPVSGLADVVVRVHERLAAAPSRLCLVTLDDLCLAELRPNVPGTTVERPNWRLPLPLTLEDLRRAPVATRVAAALNTRRPPA